MNFKIGIFDSGIGGFTILNSLLKTRNDLKIYYLADTERVPYGDKSFEQIRIIAKDICNWFGDKNLDAILVACNTTNACALDILENLLNIPCFDLINSVSEIVTKNKVGVLATPTTIKSAYYKKIIESKNEKVRVIQQECPEFVTEIEKPKLNLKKINYLADIYLNLLLKENIEEIILGCSHYPLIYDILKNKVHSNLNIIDPSVSLIKKFNNAFFEPRDVSSRSISYDKVQFFVTAKTEEFAIKVKNWLEIDKEIQLVNLRSND